MTKAKVSHVSVIKVEGIVSHLIILWNLPVTNMLQKWNTLVT